MGGVADGIAQGNRIQIDEDHTVARQENMVRLQVPMDRRRRNFFQACHDRSRDRLDILFHLRTGPLNKRRGPPHVIDLVSQRMMPPEAQLSLIKSSHGLGHRAHGRGIAALEQNLLQRSPCRLL